MFPCPRGNEDRALRVQLEVQLDRQPVRGRLRSERGTEEQFVGWLGFIEALAKLRTERGDEKR